MKSGVCACVLIYLHVQRNESYYLKQKHQKCWESKFDRDCRNMSG